MYCPNCGQELNEGVRFCPNCGTKIDDTTITQDNNTSEPNRVMPQDKSWGAGMMAFLIIISVLIPLIGIIVGLSNKSVDGREKQAKTILITSLVVIALNILIMLMSRQ